MQRTANEQLVIDKAKAIVMKRKALTEPEAYRYIQKNSMDTGRSIVESAQMIILLNRN